MPNLNDPRASVKALLLSLTKTQREQLDLIEALARALPDAGTESDLLDAKQTFAEFGIGVDGLKAAAARGELALSKGPRRRIQVSRAELLRWLASRPYKPTHKAAAPLADDVDALDAELKRGGLVRGAR